MNQRGISSGATIQPYTYFFDMWRTSQNPVQIDINSDGAVFTGSVFDVVENGASLLGETLTISVQLSSGEIDSKTVVFTDWVGASIFDGNVFLALAGNTLMFVVDVLGVRIRRVKLEMGSVSTLHLDPPQNYGMELLKCQRYYVRLSMAYMGVLHCFFPSALSGFPFPVKMRTIPTVTFGGIFRPGQPTNTLPFSAASVDASAVHFITLATNVEVGAEGFYAASCEASAEL